MPRTVNQKANIKEIVVKRRFIRSTPRKVRRAADLVQGKKISAALDILKFSHLDAARPLVLTLKNALAEAKNKDLSEDDLVLHVRVDEGPKLKRRRIIHQGRATDILKRMSHITVVLQERGKLEIGNSKFAAKRLKGASSGS